MKAHDDDVPPVVVSRDNRIRFSEYRGGVPAYVGYRGTVNQFFGLLAKHATARPNVEAPVGLVTERNRHEVPDIRDAPEQWEMDGILFLQRHPDNAWLKYLHLALPA